MIPLEDVESVQDTIEEDMFILRELHALLQDLSEYRACVVTEELIDELGKVLFNVRNEIDYQ